MLKLTQNYQRMFSDVREEENEDVDVEGVDDSDRSRATAEIEAAGSSGKVRSFIR
jgi:hypothetical protein